MIYTACSTPGMISSMLSIISSPTTGMKPLLSPDLLCKTVVGTGLAMTSPIVRASTSNGSADFKMGLQVKLLTTERTLSELVRSFKKTKILILYSGTIMPEPDAHNWQPDETRHTQLTKQWSEVPSGVPTNTSMSGTCAITRLSLLPAMWVGKQTNCLQPDWLQKSRESGPCRLAGETDSNTERIDCILSMHLGACRFFMHWTTLMHL